jgi:hypothetical protein
MPTASVDAPKRIATLGHVRSLFCVDCVDGVEDVLASCEFEPNNWLNLLPIDEPVDELPDEPPNMLPPPQPDNAVLAATASTATAARFKRLPPTIIASSWPQRSD